MASRTQIEVLSIDRAKKTVLCCDLRTAFHAGEVMI